MTQTVTAFKQKQSFLNEEKERQEAEENPNFDPERTRFKGARNHSIVHKHDVVKYLDRFTGTSSDRFISKTIKSKSLTTKGSPQITKPARLDGVSQRLNRKADFDDQRSFMFVGPTATKKEKWMKLRADIIANEKGEMVNGRELTEPSSSFVTKLDRREKLQAQ